MGVAQDQNKLEELARELVNTQAAIGSAGPPGVPQAPEARFPHFCRWGGGCEDGEDCGRDRSKKGKSSNSDGASRSGVARYEAQQSPPMDARQCHCQHVEHLLTDMGIARADIDQLMAARRW